MKKNEDLDMRTIKPSGVGNVIIWFVHTFLPVTWEIWSAKSEEHWKMRHKVLITASYKVTLFIRKSFERYLDFNSVKDYVQWTISGCCHLAVFGLHARVHQYLTGRFCPTPTRSSPWIPLRKIENVACCRWSNSSCVCFEFVHHRGAFKLCHLTLDGYYCNRFDLKAGVCQHP